MENDDVWQKREQELFRAERDKLKDIERERAFLKDRSIGGHAPRPTDDYIDKSLGKPLNDDQILKQARETAGKKVAQEQAAERQQQRGQDKAQERKTDQSRKKLSEQMREQRQRAQEHKRKR